MSHMKPYELDQVAIQEMTDKILNKIQAAIQSSVTTHANQSMNITNSLDRANKLKSDASSTSTNCIGYPRQIDEESIRGRFGWTTIGKTHIFYLFRNGEKYCSVRIVELKILSEYRTLLHQGAYKCACISSYYVTETESRLLNEINFWHCNSQFGCEIFTPKDLIVRLADVVEFIKFLDACHLKLRNGNANPGDKFGFIRIDEKSMIPFTLYKGRQYLPLFFFEGETEVLKSKAEDLDGWNVAYLKFCCKLLGIRNEFFSPDSCQVVSLKDIKSCFPPRTLFEVYWPKVIGVERLMEAGDNQIHLHQWIRQPAIAS